MPRKSLEFWKETRNMSHKVDPNNLKPCPHMRTLVSAWVDGKLTGLARWYTEWHVRDCPQCQASLPFLRSLSARLNALPAPSPSQESAAGTLAEERWAKIEASWEQTERDL